MKFKNRLLVLLLGFAMLMPQFAASVFAETAEPEVLRNTSFVDQPADALQTEWDVSEGKDSSLAIAASKASPTHKDHTYENAVCVDCGIPEGLRYRIENGAVEVTRYTGSAESLVIPETIEDLPVRIINGRSFDDNETLRSVYLPDSVIKIEYMAFYGLPLLEQIHLPDGITDIEYSAFSYCAALRDITIPESLSELPKELFKGCRSLKSIVIPANIKKIGESAFEASGLAEVTITEGVAEISDDAFAKCKITKLILPSSVKTVGQYAFNHCTNLEEILFSEGLESIGSAAFQWCEKLRKLDLPDSVEIIGEYAFQHCYALKEVRLPAGITRIEKRTFDYCEKLAEIRIPSAVAYIGEEAFYYSGVKSVIFTGKAPEIDGTAFCRVYTDAYYPAGDPTWTSDVMQNYCGKIVWIPYCPTEHSFVNGKCEFCGEKEALAGDLTGDDEVSYADVQYFLWHILFPDCFPITGNPDYTRDGEINSMDAAYLLWYLTLPEKYPLS